MARPKGIKSKFTNQQIQFLRPRIIQLAEQMLADAEKKETGMLTRKEIFTALAPYIVSKMPTTIQNPDGSNIGGFVLNIGEFKQESASILTDN